MSLAYHSVYRPVSGAAPVQRWQSGDNVAFVHDLLTGPLPTEYDQATLLYTELPWQAGFAGYNQRAGVDDARSYRQFLAAVADVVSSVSKPVVIVAGAHAVPRLPAPDLAVPVVLSLLPKKPTAQALAYRCRIPEVTDNVDLITWLASQHAVVGDFCCGYGLTGRIFRQNGGRFVLSDFVGECIGHIAAHASNWAIQQ